MQTKQKSNTIVTTRLEGDRIVFAVAGQGELTFDPAKAAQSNRLHAEIHGWVQRIVDKAAIGVTDKDGNVIPRTERSRMKYHAMNEVITHYESGSEDWSMKGQRVVADDELTIRAVMAVKSMSYDDVQASINRQSEALQTKRSAVLAALRGNKAVAEKMAELRPVNPKGDEILESL